MQTLLQIFQPPLYAHGGNRAVQGRHACVLEILQGGSGVVHNPLPQGGQRIPRPLHFIFKVGHSTLHDGFYGGLLLLGKLGFDLLQFPQNSVKLALHAVQIPGHKGQILSLDGPAVLIQQL